MVRASYWSSEGYRLYTKNEIKSFNVFVETKNKSKKTIFSIDINNFLLFRQKPTKELVYITTVLYETSNETS